MLDHILTTLLIANQLTSIYFVPAIPWSFGTVSIGTLLPFAEELVFRMFIPKMLSDLGIGADYSNETSTVIFALVHLTNPLIMKTMGWKMVLYQFYNTLVAGYYLARLNNIYLAIIGHILFNSIVLTGAAIKFRFQHSKEEEHTCKGCCQDPQYSMMSNDFGRAYSCSNLDELEYSDDEDDSTFEWEYKVLPDSAKEVKASFQRFDNKMQELRFSLAY